MDVSTKAQIEQTFLAFLAEKPISQIKVKDITAACHINRNTFYYYYKSLSALVDSIVQNSIKHFFELHPVTADTLESCIISAIHAAKAHQASIYHIYDSTRRSIFERHLWRISEYVTTAYLGSIHSRQLPPEEYAIHHELLCLTNFGFIMKWLAHGMPLEIIDTVPTFVKTLKASAHIA